jgi:hypothetical protein
MRATLSNFDAAGAAEALQKFGAGHSLNVPSRPV